MRSNHPRVTCPTCGKPVDVYPGPLNCGACGAPIPEARRLIVHVVDRPALAPLPVPIAVEVRA